jgi:hypothetical protein
MAEYSRLASGKVISNGGTVLVPLPFIPDFIGINNQTRAVNASGVTNASWNTDMGQGAAFRSLYGTGEQYIDVVGGTSTAGLTNGTGFSTIQAGLALQYGAKIAVTSITKVAGAPVVTTSAAHNLVSGNVVVFQNLYQTATTGMQQIAGIPFVIVVTGATTFTITWDNSGSNYTAISAGGLNSNVSLKQVLYPDLYQPGTAVIQALTLSSTTTVTTTTPNNFVVGQQVAFRIPTIWGTSQLNSLPNVLIPGSPVYGYVVSVTNSQTFVVNINSAAFTAFNPNQVFASFPGEFFPQVVAVGDVNTGGQAISAGSALYPSPLIYNGFGTTQVSTINGPAINGAYINATFQGFLIGSGVSGTASDIIFWRAYMSDLNV